MEEFDRRIGELRDKGMTAPAATARVLGQMAKDASLGKGRAQVKAHQELANEQAKKSR